MGKVQIVKFFDCRGMIYQHICPPQQKINCEYNATILRQLLGHIHRKCLELVNNWILHQDNAPHHKAHSIAEFWEERNVKVMERLPYSLDLASCDFWLFPVLKKALRGRQFHSGRELLTATQTFFNCLLESQFHKTFEDKWKVGTQSCILNRGRDF